MSGAVSNRETVDLFKTCYGDIHNLLPEDYVLQKEIPFEDSKKVGDKWVEAVILTFEVGVTFGGNAMEAFEIEPAVAGAVKQAEVEPYSIVLPSLVPFGVISRSAGGGEKAFYSATKHIVKNNLRSHSKFLEATRVYGQSDGMLGHISYTSNPYRGKAFSNGSGTIKAQGEDITFTNGINVAKKASVTHPGEFASGLWVGMEGVVIQALDSVTNEVLETMKLKGVDAEQGVLFWDKVPPAASALPGAAGAVKLAFKGWAEKKEAIGINKILTSSDTLFGINQKKYALFNGIKVDADQKKFTFGLMQQGVAAAVNRGGLEGDLLVLCNPRSWSNLNTTEAGSRSYDQSYKSGEAENGFERITYYHQTGKLVVAAHRGIKEGEAYGLYLPVWSRSGSADVSFTVPNMDKEVIFPLENQAAYCFRSYSDQYIFCHTPAQNIIWQNINDEASS